MTAPAIEPAPRWTRARDVPLRWGGYRERLAGGLWLIVGGGLAIAGSNTNVLWLLYLGTAAHILGWCVLPSVGWRRVAAVFPSTLAMWLLLTGPRFLFVLLLPYLGWLLVRHRRPLAYVTVVPVLLGAVVFRELSSQYAEMPVALAVEALIMVGSAYLAAWLDRSRSHPPSPEREP